MTETVFSSMKRMFGEHVSARKFPNMVKEIFIKASLYNRFNQIVQQAFLSTDNSGSFNRTDISIIS